jgi:hypothetical protein
MALNKSALAAMFLMMTSAYSSNILASACEVEYQKAVKTWDDPTVKTEDNSLLNEDVYQRAVTSGKYYMTADMHKSWSYLLNDYDIARIRSIDDAISAAEGQGANNNVEAKLAWFYQACLLKAERDGTLKSSKQAKNIKSTAESKQSQSANTNSKDASNQASTDNDTSSNNKPLTKAELKAQKAEQQAQQDEQQAQQATQVAQDHQTKANQKRQGKRRRHEPENEAHKCISPDFGGLYGGMENTCNFKVWYTYCGYHPTENSWLRGMACEKQSFGTGLVSPGRQDAAHTHGVEKLYWFACKDPAWPVDVEFVDGDIKGRCHTVGGGSD